MVVGVLHFYKRMMMVGKGRDADTVAKGRIYSNATIISMPM